MAERVPNIGHEPADGATGQTHDPDTFYSEGGPTNDR